MTVILYSEPPEPQADLPDGPSALVRLAIADARRLDRVAYRPDSDEWFLAGADVCRVSLAGAVIAGTLVDDDWIRRERPVDLSPIDFPRAVSRKLSALLSICRGELLMAREWWRLMLDDGEAATDPAGLVRAHQSDAATELRRDENAEYKDWAAFDRHLGLMEALADALEGEGAWKGGGHEEAHAEKHADRRRRR